MIAERAHRRLLALVLATVSAAACRRPSSASDADASPGDAGVGPSGGGSQITSRVHDAAGVAQLRLDLDALTETALADAGARPGPPSVAPVLYERAPCPLTYAFRARVEMTVDNAPRRMQGRGIEWSGRFEVRAGKTPGEVEISTIEESSRHVVGGRRNPGAIERPAESPVHVSGDGRSWRLEEPTSLRWDGMGSFWGLIIDWPALPAQSVPGTRTPWNLTQAVRWNASTVDAKRYPLPPRPAGLDRPVSIDAEVRVLRTLDLGGAPAIAVEGVGAVRNDLELPGMSVVPDAAPLGGAKTSGATIFAGQYVVLGSGRLLHAAFRMDTDVVMDFGGAGGGKIPGPMHHHHALVHEARLVAACDGPKLPEFAPRTPTDDEAALESFARFRDAVVKKDRDGVVRELAPSLLARHGEANVLRALFRVADQHGPTIFGVPELADEGTRRGSEVRFVLSSSSRPSDPKMPRVNVGRLELAAELNAGQARIVSIEMDDLRHHRLFELSDARFVDAVRPIP